MTLVQVILVGLIVLTRSCLDFSLKVYHVGTAER